MNSSYGHQGHDGHLDLAISRFSNKVVEVIHVDSPTVVLKKVFYSFPIKAVHGVVLPPSSPMVLFEVFYSS